MAPKHKLKQEDTLARGVKKRKIAVKREIKEEHEEEKDLQVEVGDFLPSSRGSNVKKEPKIEEIEEEEASDLPKPKATRKTKPKKKTEVKKRKTNTNEGDDDDDLTSLKNIGPDTTKKLREVGIQSCQQFKKLSDDEIFEKWLEMRTFDRPGRSVTCVAALLAMYGARENKHWMQAAIPQHLKERVEEEKQTKRKRDQAQKRKVVKVKR